MTGDSTLTLDNQSLREQNRRLAVILDITAAVSSELDLDRLLRLCVSKITEALDADRTSLFLVDHKNHMLWSKVAQGDGMAEIRFPNGIGVAGHVGTTGETLNILEAYDDPRFNKSFDVQTGYRTKTILCMPMRDRNQRIFGVVQVLNKRIGHFDAADEDLLATLSAPIVAALENAQLVLEVQKRMERTRVLLDVMRSLSSELDLDRLLVKIMQRITEVMHADRSTLFLIDFKTNQLWSKVAQGVGLLEIRVPIGVGIAGTVAATGETINIPDAYADGRFNQDVDRRTGYHTRTILCMPMRDEQGRVVGVVQCLNKSDGIFTEDDEDLLGALASQANIALSNARLFDEVSYMKNYNESILSSIATGVITFDLEGNVTTANPAAVKIFALGEGEHTGRHFADLVGGSRNERVVEAVQSVFDSRQPHVAYELQYNSASDDVVSLNLNVIPLQTPRGDLLGVVLVAQDITQEQRLMGTLCRYVTREVAEQILQNKDSLKLGGSKREVTVLFSDIRGFTSISEIYSAEEIVQLLNEYFTRMVNVIFKHEGTLDKFIGDAIMAVFGAPIVHDDDPVRAVRSAIEMRKELFRYNEERIARGELAIETGIGICHGEALSGNIGSDMRMDYTVIGDAVNVASRLEGLTKTYDCKILFSESVYEDVKDVIPCIDLGYDKVKGRGAAVRLYGVPDSVILAEYAADSAERATPSPVL